MTNFDPTIGQLQEIRQYYDGVHPFPYKDVILHSLYHISRASQKGYDALEVADHSGSDPDFTIIDKEVIPDLVIIATMLANERGLNLGALVLQRLYEIEARGAIPGTVDCAIDSVTQPKTARTDKS